MNTLVSNIQGYSIHDGPGIRTTVFLKGCGLACQWCSNPENISFKPELGYIANLCANCGACAEACSEHAITIEENYNHIDRKRCTCCGDCESICSHHALVLYGRSMSVEEVFDIVKRDQMFYVRSGGGITISGGEPLLHHQFVSLLFEKCHLEDIHTCIETSGYAPSPNLIEILPLSNYVLFDLKFLDAEKHKQYTGKLNTLIQENAKIVANSGVDFLFRMPLIPDVNNSLQNIYDTIDFLRSLGGLAKRIELMPYHRLGESKYRALGKEYILQNIKPMEIGQAEAVQQIFEQNGISCTISR